jgi:hypothetical protein
MGELVHIDGETIASSSGENEECILRLEELLDKAKNGEVVGIVCAVQYADGAHGCAEGGFVYDVRMAGELFCAATRLATK